MISLSCGFCGDSQSPDWESLWNVWRDSGAGAGVVESGYGGNSEDDGGGEHKVSLKVSGVGFWSG